MEAEIFSQMSTRRVAPARLAALAAIALAAPVAPANAGSTSLDLRGAWTYDTNISNAQEKQFREKDSIFEFDAIAGYRHELNENSGIVAKGGIETDGHTNFGDLNSLTLVGSLAYVLQPWRSFTAPWFALSTDLRWLKHEDSDIRDGTIATFAFTAGQQVTDRISSQLRFELLDRNADEGRVFEMIQRILSAAVDYKATDRLTAYAKYEYLNGGLVTTAPPNMKFRGVTRAVSMDPAFGPGRMAWRLDGHAHTFRLGSKYRLAEHTALDMGMSLSHADAGNNNQWNRWQLGVGLQHRF